MQLYYHDGLDTPENFCEDHNSGEEVSVEELTNIGVLYYHLDEESQVEKIAKERDYKNRDLVVLSDETFPGGPDALQEKLKVFYKEHLHEDEEIRFILDGEGYFDVRSQNDRWIRSKLFKGDLLILPAGIYHRFTLTTKKYVKTMRLFKDEPKWQAFNRPADDKGARLEYLKSIQV
ncbi:BA75_02759T0 [Komagataella pastoris]|uniref:Acireductone dioxygenase n=1 Tax=Komagataella pastoris TaxID=4922 RepID=A0A1B2JCI7_PICPA|nr:BA75_02759T0 [Komagataella pastoris]